MTERRDEVSYSDYQFACVRAARTCAALESASPDEAAEVLLPRLTQQIAVIFSFVGANMTARHVPGYFRTVAEYQAAKDVTVAAEAGTLPADPDRGGK